MAEILPRDIMTIARKYAVNHVAVRLIDGKYYLNNKELKDINHQCPVNVVAVDNIFYFYCKQVSRTIYDDSGKITGVDYIGRIRIVSYDPVINKTAICYQTNTGPDIKDSCLLAMNAISIWFVNNGVCRFDIKTKSVHYPIMDSYVYRFLVNNRDEVLIIGYDAIHKFYRNYQLIRRWSRGIRDALLCDYIVSNINSSRISVLNTHDWTAMEITLPDGAKVANIDICSYLAIVHNDVCYLAYIPSVLLGKCPARVNMITDVVCRDPDNLYLLTHDGVIRICHDNIDMLEDTATPLDTKAMVSINVL